MTDQQLLTEDAYAEPELPAEPSPIEDAGKPGPDTPWKPGSDVFQPAKRASVKARIALFGPSKSGKTYTALAIASGLGEHIALIDAENGSAALYAEDFAFDTARLGPPFHPRRYAQAIAEAAKAGYDVVIVDGISPAWNGAGGVQEIVDKNQKGGNKFSGWAVGTPAHQELVNAITSCGAHIICTMRSATAYEMGEKNKPQRVGLKPVQRDEIEYEFHILGLMDQQHRVEVAGRGAFSDMVIEPAKGEDLAEPGRMFGQFVSGWLGAEAKT